MPGTLELLRALEPPEAEERALVGLLTGNVAPGAALKLRSAGLDPARFRVGAYGSDSARRADLPAGGAGGPGEGPHRPFAGAGVVGVGRKPGRRTGGRTHGPRRPAAHS